MTNYIFFFNDPATTEIYNLSLHDALPIYWGNETVKVLNSSSELIQEMKGQATLSKWASAFLETNKEEGLSRKNANLDNLNALEDTEDPHTVSAHIEKLFWSPVSVKLQKENLLLVTESNRHRIQVYEIK